MNIIPLFSVHGENHYFDVFATVLPLDCKHRAAHFAALDLLSSVVRENYGAANLHLMRDENGKPQLIHPFLHMNLTHCKGLAVLAIGNLPVGVDVEPPRICRDAARKHVCCAEESRQILTSKNADAMFSRIWTLKEAYGKWHGGGIRLPLSEICFSIEPNRVTFLHPDAADLSFHQFLLEIDGIPYAVSVCTERIPDSQILRKCDGFLISTENGGLFHVDD